MSQFLFFYFFHLKNQSPQLVRENLNFLSLSFAFLEEVPVEKVHGLEAIAGCWFNCIVGGHSREIFFKINWFSKIKSWQQQNKGSSLLCLDLASTHLVLSMLPSKKFQWEERDQERCCGCGVLTKALCRALFRTKLSPHMTCKHLFPFCF